MRIRKSKGNGNYKMNLTEKELVTFTVALANLDADDVIKDSEDELVNMKQDSSVVIEQSVVMFDELATLTDMYKYEELEK